MRRVLSPDQENRQELDALKMLISRGALTSSLGKMYGSDRDYYDALGWSKNPTFADYYKYWERQDVAKRVIRAYPDATWGDPPEVTDNQKVGASTPFQKAWKELVKTKRIYHYLHRADVLSGIGRYGGLFLGFNGAEGDKLKDAVTPVNGLELMYMRPAYEDSLQIDDFENDINNERYQLPLHYKLQQSNDTETALPSTINNEQIHWSRIIHIAEGLEENDVFGTPRLKAILNRLLGIDLIAGGGAEMFWRGAFPGLAVVADKEANFSPADKEELADEIDKYVHDLQRFIKAQGVDIKALQTNITGPKEALMVLLRLISIDTKIPLRILTGSERGELASTQDDKAWNDRVHERRTNFAEPIILRPFIDRLIQFKVMPPPENGEYDVLWPELQILSAKEEAEIAKLKTEALRNYIQSGAEDIFPPSLFFKDMFGYSQDAVDDMALDTNWILDEEDEDAKIISSEEDE